MFCNAKVQPLDGVGEMSVFLFENKGLVESGETDNLLFDGFAFFSVRIVWVASLEK